VRLVTGALYEGRVMHTRPTGQPGRYLFSHGLYLWLIDVDRPPRLPLVLRPLGRLRSRDHLGDPDRSVRENLEAFLAGNGVDLGGGQVLLLTNLRAMGYVFNPLSVYWCHDPAGSLRCIVAEVHNTHGERHCYLLEPGERGHAEADKAFYVSPFLTVDGRYRMSFSEPGERLSIQMELVQEGRRVFQASLTGRRRPLTNAGLARMALRYPLMTARVSALIRWHGVRLWLRRVPRVPRPRHPQKDGAR
jgi:DUF1365 family protein